MVARLCYNLYLFTDKRKRERKATDINNISLCTTCSRFRSFIFNTNANALEWSIVITKNQSLGSSLGLPQLWL